MHSIEHPSRFRTGTRVLLLKGRHKDGLCDERTIMRVSHDAEQFGACLRELQEAWRDGERIYVSAGPRSMSKAIRIFKERQLAAEYDGDPELFYRSVDRRWASCLMSPRAQDKKLWLFDCDTAEESEAVEAELSAHYDREAAPYRYVSKTGVHFVVAPFNRALLSDQVRALIHENPLMLWAH